MITKQEHEEEVKFSKFLESSPVKVYYYSNQELMQEKSRKYNKLNKEKLKEKNRIKYLERKEKQNGS